VTPETSNHHFTSIPHFNLAVYCHLIYDKGSTAFPHTASFVGENERCPKYEHAPFVQIIYPAVQIEEGRDQIWWTDEGGPEYLTKMVAERAKKIARRTVKRQKKALASCITSSHTAMMALLTTGSRPLIAAALPKQRTLFDW